MKKSLALAAIVLLSACGKKEQTNSSTTDVASKVVLTLKGSDTVLPLAQKEAEKFMETNKDATITVVGGGSGVGITALQDGTTDIAMSSRPLKMEEKLKFEEAKLVIKEVVIGNDALAVVVNPKNKVAQLTKEQIADIFTGKVKNWKEVGGSDMKIVAYSRESSSGTYEFFKEHVMDKKNYDASILNMPATGAIVQSVSQTEGAIGYIGLAYTNKDVKSIGVSYDAGKTFTLPSVAAAQDLTYPIARPLYFYYDEKKQTVVEPFINYILSEEGQNTVLEVGYVPLKK